VASILRSGRRSPWTDEPTAVDALSGAIDDASLPEAHVASREAFDAVLQRLRAALTPRGLELFYALFVDGASVESVCRTTAMSEDAVYAAKSRILKVLRKVAAEIDAERDSAPTAAAQAARGAP
jgi:RNA polymerase sigma-70 factor (ECF subfamily)